MKKRREFRKAYNTYHVLLFNWLYLKTGRSEDAEDICQEVFIKFFKNFDTIEPLKRWSWIKTAGRYELANYIRRKEHAQNSCMDITAIEENRFPAEREDGILTRVILEEIIEDESTYNDEIEKSVFHLIAIYGYTVKEAAGELGLTERKTRYRYARVSRKIVHILSKKNLSRIEDVI
jgi:RNA polymerase sigma-70 factor (ECF subfamily)